MENPQSAGLPDIDARMLAEILVHDPRIELPAHLLQRTAADGTLEAVEAGTNKKEEYILQLLRHDAGVFLERHGKLLSIQNLRPFEMLKDNYEVGFYLKLLKADAVATKSRKAKIRNRRLAHYNLNKGNGFFSMEAMQDRDPLLWQQYIGRYTKRPEHLPMTNGKVYENILRQHDASELDQRVRAAQLWEARKQAEEEEETDSDEEEEQLRQQQQRRAEEGAIGQAKMQGVPSLESGPRQQQQQQQQAGVAAASTSGASSAGFSTALPQTPVFGGVDDLPGDYRPMCATEEQQEELREEFVEAMMIRFLNGGDREHFEYSSVDDNASLDEFWARSAGRDHEEAYFDAD